MSKRKDLEEDELHHSDLNESSSAESSSDDVLERSSKQMDMVLTLC